MSKPKVVLLNMCQRNGKDELATELINRWGEDSVRRLSFKIPLIQITANVLGISVGEFLEGYDDKVSDRPCVIERQIGQGYVWWKDVPIYEINGRVYSKRTALIYVSEKVIKPSFGESVFGNILSSQLSKDKLNVFSDSGFDAEASPLYEVADVLVLKRDRLKSNWEGDSRGWLDPTLGGTHKWCPEEITELKDFFDWSEKQIVNWMRAL